MPAQTTRRTAPASSSKSASQTQETSRPSAIRSLRAIQRSIRRRVAASSRSVRSTSLAPAGFLISRIETAVPADLDRLDPAEGGAHPPRAAAIRSGATPSCEAGGDRGERVVDVVEAGQRQLQRDLALRGANRDREPSIPRSSIAVAATSGRGRSRAAVRAGVVAEVADEGALVGVGMAAAAAVLGVEGVLQLGQRLGGVLDPEVEDALAALARRRRGRGRRSAGRRR